MTLRKGDVAGPEVDCHFSTPEEPTNPELSPAGAWCLIPKQTLEPRTKYTVIVRWTEGDESKVWSFTTGG